jgi:hypothetical protein
MLGTHRMTNSFFGQAGNNGTSQINSENQGTFTPYGTYSADSCWYGGGAGQGNSSSFAGPDVRNNCTFYNPAGGSAFRSNGATNAMGLLPKVTNSTFYGSVAGNLSADSTGNTSLPFDPNFTIPTFTKPPWAWW